MIVWQEIKKLDNKYAISNDGQLRNSKTGRILRYVLNKKGYVYISLKPNGRKDKGLTVKIHRLVAEAFVPNPENKPYVNHIDCNKQNNQYLNLEWVTPKENSQHAEENNLVYHGRGEDNIQAKLTNADAAYIRENYKPFDSNFGARALGRKYGVAKSLITKIIHKQSYKI